MIPKLAIGLIVAPIAAFIMAMLGYDLLGAVFTWLLGSVWWAVRREFK